MTGVRALALAAALVLAAGACTSSDSGRQPTTTTTAAPAPTEAVDSASPPSSGPGAPPVPDLTWEPCRAALECATLVAPLDYDDPNGPTIDVAMARLPARDPDKRIGSLFTNPGGPGASGIDLLIGGGLLPGAVRDRFDIVSWDPRGVGDTAALGCGSNDEEYQLTDPTPDDDAEAARLSEEATAIADECQATDAGLLPYLGTETTIQDLDLMRAALGEDQLSYIGYSYGTLIGELYADRYPDRVRAMVLDGVVDPTSDLAETARGQALGIESSLEKMFESCGSGCELEDPAAVYDDVARRLEDGEQGDEGPSVLTLAAWRASYDEASWSRFLDALAAADDGDLDGLRALANSYIGLAPFSPYVAVLCLDLSHPPDYAGFEALADDLAAEAPRLGGSLGFELLPCAFWPVEPTRRPDPVRATGSAPILVVGNEGDAATPIENAESVADQLDDARLLVLDGEGHLSVGDPCIDDWVTAYLVDLELPPEGTVC